VIASLLHGIRHYLPHVQSQFIRKHYNVYSVELIDDNAPGSQRSRDAVGAVYLKTLGFPASVADIVNAHVVAKRYLTAVDSTYYDQLSQGSKTRFGCK
jgi:predicted HD phosphohydrolase